MATLNITPRVCSTCRAYRANEAEEESRKGECRRKSPTAFLVAGKFGPVAIGSFPAVLGAGWCCDWLDAASPNRTTEET